MESLFSSIEHENLTLPRMVQFMMREGACQRAGPLEACDEVMQRSGGYGSGSIHGERIDSPSVAVGFWTAEVPAGPGGHVVDARPCPQDVRGECITSHPRSAGGEACGPLTGSRYGARRRSARCSRLPLSQRVRCSG